MWLPLLSLLISLVTTVAIDVAAVADPVPKIFGEIPPEFVTVDVKQGKLQGFVHEIGRKAGIRTAADIFLGVSYAQPPIGELRFEKPLEPKPYAGGIFKADKYAPGCISLLPSNGNQTAMAASSVSEDCLYLNVFAPSNKSSRLDERGFPVLVWIHGGGFSSGSASLYPYQAFAANFVSRGIVVVTIQYRLGVFGFFSTGDKQMPGNIGLWDQRSALLWIQENIKNFGGDPTRVTLWGQQSGAANVGALSLSRKTRDLFTQSIEISGSVYAGWANSKSVVGSSKKIAKLVNCPHKSSKKLKTCLKDVDALELAQKADKLGWRRDDINFVRMQMTPDQDFFETDLDTLLQESPPKATMMGWNSQEAMVLNKMLAFDRSKLEQFINTTVIPDKLMDRDQNLTEQARANMTWFYIDRNFSTDGRYYLTKYTQILSDLQYSIPNLIEIFKKTQQGWPVFTYLMDYMNPTFKIPVLGTFQTYEFPYLFGFSVIGPFEFDDNDRKLQKVLVNSIATFVHTGNPSNEYSLTWPQANQNNSFVYMDMRAEPKIKENLMLDRQIFWSDMARNYSFNLVADYDKLSLKPKNEF